MNDVLANAIWSLTPTLVMAVFFAWMLRLVLRADRNERRAYQDIEREERARMGLPPKQ